MAAIYTNTTHYIYLYSTCIQSMPHTTWLPIAPTPITPTTFTCMQSVPRPTWPPQILPILHLHAYSQCHSQHTTSTHYMAIYYITLHDNTYLCATYKKHSLHWTKNIDVKGITKGRLGQLRCSLPRLLCT